MLTKKYKTLNNNFTKTLPNRNMKSSNSDFKNPTLPENKILSSSLDLLQIQNPATKPEVFRPNKPPSSNRTKHYLSREYAMDYHEFCPQIHQAKRSKLRNL
ncbi:hypothetical protein M758_1G115500 [Ceratodon purpureus]|nr:hypothetical protein M758_1G115500 [Ceratodon purpureus]